MSSALTCAGRAILGPTGVLLFVLLAGPARPAVAQNALAEEGVFVAVPNPITSEAVTRIKNRVETARGNPSRPARAVVFDFNPGGKEAATTDFGACYELASFIAQLHDLKTIAFVPAPARGHTVLPVLACKEIVMARSASLGEIAKSGDPPPGRVVETAYDDILGKPREPYRAVVRKMYDRGVSLGRGQKDNGVYYVDLEHADRYEKAGVVIPDRTPLPALGANAPGVFPAERLRELGLVSALADSRKDLADVYRLSPASLRDDPLSGRPPVAYKYTLRGPVDGGVKEAVTRIVKDVVRQNGNVLFLELECGGGDFQAARDLADELVKFQQGDNPILVVGFVPNAAPDTAAVVALGCSEVVMSRRKDAGAEEPEATIGDFEALLGRGKDTNQVELWKTSLRALAEQQGYPLLLVDGMLDRDLEVVRVHAANERGRRRLMTLQEFEAAKADWVHEKTVKPRGQLLKLSATDAAELGIARHVVDARDLAEVYAVYGVKPGEVREATPGWLDRFATYLRLPTVTVLLVVIGFAGLILELKVPGTTVPGIIAALCFILVFWAHSQFNGQAAVLGGLLFALGLVLILMEVFVIPGFGVTGLLGVVFMLGGVGLATLNQIPETADEWGAYGGKVGQYVVALAAGMAVAFAVARFLPKIPYANKLMLAPPTERSESEAVVELPGAALAASLLGAVGLAATPLRPAGMAVFGDQYVDVVTEGGFIPSGARVQVIEVEGIRIVVKEV